MQRNVFVTGATGYIGRRLTAELLARGHRVRALARRGSEARVPPGATAVVGDALDPTTFQDAIAPADTLVHLVGVAHPSPNKANEFRSVDLASVDAAVAAARASGVRHFVYVSVAQPAPVMRAYVEARRMGEERLGASGLNATIVRPWYVLGPGHWWPILLLPVYAVAWLLPGRRAAARRLGLVTIGTMVRALLAAVELPTDAPARAGLPRVLDVPAIREAGGRRPGYIPASVPAP